MPEFNCYINDKERGDLFEFVTNKKGLFVPKLGYKSTIYLTVESSEDFIRQIEQKTVGFYIISESFQIEPLLIKQNRFFEEPTYYVVDRTGGPYIDISLYRGFADNAVIPFKCTWISLYPRFIHCDSPTYEEFKTTNEAKTYYEGIVRFLKSKCQRIQVHDRKYWVSKAVIKELGM